MGLHNKDNHLLIQIHHHMEVEEIHLLMVLEVHKCVLKVHLPKQHLMVVEEEILNKIVQWVVEVVVCHHLEILLIIFKVMLEEDLEEVLICNNKEEIHKVLDMLQDNQDNILHHHHRILWK